MIDKLPRKFYSRSTEIVAQELLGKTLVHKTEKGAILAKIVETEAYFGQKDPGSHAYRGISARNRIMFGPAGKAYIYLVYGRHYCLNIVTEKCGIPGAVLIRAAEPIEGIQLMRKNRRIGERLAHLTNGPGKLTAALGITASLNGTDLTGNKLFVVSDTNRGETREPSTIFGITKAGRIGIKEGSNLPYRYYIEGNKFVSRTIPIKNNAPT